MNGMYTPTVAKGFGTSWRAALLCALWLSCTCASPAQKTDSLQLQPKRLAWTMGIAGTASGASLVLLNQLWYADYPRSSFHFIDDNDQWMQVDKAGHFWSAYMSGSIMYDALQACGVKNKKAIWWGGSAGLLYLTMIECMDGTSRQWGFSWGDQLANSLGAFAFISQQELWNEQRITFKFSYANTDYAALNPNQLGRNFQQRLLKDYNGQTYWMSYNIHSFLAPGADFPRWLNVAFGYGATKMTQAKMNVHDVNNFHAQREFYVSFDADLNRIQWPKKWMRVTARILNHIKIPAPTLRIQSDGTVRWHAAFF
jgi:hypothetical protein